MADSITASNTIIPTDVGQQIDKRLLEMFVDPSAEVGVHSTFTHIVEPTRQPNPKDQEFIFELPDLGSSYIDLKRTELYVSGRLKLGDGGDIPDNVGLVNNPMHSLFESVTLYIGSNQTEVFSGYHPYKAYIRQLMDRNEFTPRRELEGFSINFGENKEITDVTSVSLPYGFIRTKNSKKVEFIGPTLIDLFQTEGYLLPQTRLKIKYRKSHESFYVHSHKDLANTSFNFEIDKIYLRLKAVNVLTPLIPLLEAQTEEAPAKYNYDALDTRCYTLPKGTLTKSFLKMYEGRLPSKILLAVYSQKQMTGDKTLSPFLTYNTNIKRVSLKVNGVVIRELVQDFDEGIYFETYKQFMEWLGVIDESAQLTASTYAIGNRYMAFDLVDNCEGEKCSEVALLSGVIDITIEFKTSLDEDCVLAAFNFSPDSVEISHKRASRHTKTIV